MTARREWTTDECVDAYDAADTGYVVDIGRALLTLREERDEALGIGPGMNDGPFTQCTECGRRMVWQYPVNVDAGEPGAPSWTCPNCVVRSLQYLRSDLALLRAEVLRGREHDAETHGHGPEARRKTWDALIAARAETDAAGALGEGA